MKKMITITLLIIGLVCLAYFITMEAGYLPLYPYIQNFEEDEFAGEPGFIRPTVVVDEIAFYAIGS
ncbi:MAG: hypothetical protein P8Y68_18910, partial [Anaerolineales bacterium]